MNEKCAILNGNYNEYMKLKTDTFREKINQQAVWGCFSKTTDSSFVEAMAVAGADFVILDMEHGPITTETLKTHIMALKATNTLAIVRVENTSSDTIGKALDLGADGIQVPSVSSASEAQKAIERAKFFPDGSRGVCRFVRAADYSDKERAAYFQEANRNIMILQLEGVEGLENFEEIIKIKGIDIIFIGPYDLSQSLQVPGQIEHPLVTRKIEEMIQLANKHQILLGTFCDTFEQLHKWKNLGISYLAYSVDVGLFKDAISQIGNQVK